MANSSVTPALTCAAGITVRVYVNSRLVSLTKASATGTATGFGTVLGQLGAGDVVYVAAGATSDAGCTAEFSWDFSLQQFVGNAAANMAAAAAGVAGAGPNGVVWTGTRDCEPTDAGAIMASGSALQVCFVMWSFSQAFSWAFALPCTLLPSLRDV